MAKVILALPDDVSTDVIYPGRFMATVLPSETPRHAFADFEAVNAGLNNGTLPAGSCVVAGANFGCGSSREQAVSCLKGHGLIVIAKSFARIFFQNAVNLGLLCITCPSIEASVGDEVESAATDVINKTSVKRFPLTPIPPARRAIVEAGGLVAYTRRKLMGAAP